MVDRRRSQGSTTCPWKIDAAAVVLLFDRLIFHNGRNAEEIENKTAWKSIVRTRVERFREGDIRGLWIEAESGAPTPDPKNTNPTPTQPLQDPARLRQRISQLAEEACRKGNLSRGMNLLLNQITEPLDQGDGEVIRKYGEKACRATPENLEPLADWEKVFKETHSSMDASVFTLGTFTPKGSTDEVDTLKFVVAHLDKTTASGT